MGAWGYHFDENDSAADWLDEFSDAPDWAAVADALSASGSDYVELDEGSAAIAAAELVAAANGQASPRLDGKLSEWAKANAAEGTSLKASAIAAVAAVRDGGELSELWQEADAAEWLSSLDDLTTRLN